MKQTIIVLMAISLFSCSFDTDVHFSIKNNTKNVIKNIEFKTNYDSITIRELKPNESFEKELLYSKRSDRNDNNSFGFQLIFYKDNIKDSDFFCHDIYSDDYSDKKVNLIMLENEIEADIQGIECY
jgi:hypothetical protein